MLKHKIITPLIISVFAFLAIGSESVPQSTVDWTAKPIRYGIVANKDIRIVAEDGSFELKGGERFETPFSVLAWSGASANLFTGSNNLLNHYPTSLQYGAKRVKVYQQGHDEPLYGVLAFNQAIGSAYGPASNSYMVQIPDGKLDAARSGVTAVAYEEMNWRSTWDTGASSNKTWYAWSLWISAFPL